MKYLLAGMESKAKIDLIVAQTKIKSESTLDAIYDHLVKGILASDAVAINGAIQQNFNRTLVKLNEMAEMIEKVKELDYAHINQQTDVNGE